MCCDKPCLVRVWLDGAWYYQCLNCPNLTPA